MPNRVIKEKCRTSPTLAALSDAGERLFWRLSTMADDYGRFENDAEIIRGACCPRLKKWTEKKVKSCLAEFGTVAPGDDEPLVVFYIVKGRRYGQFTKWEEHQRQRDSKPKFPGPEEGTVETIQSAASCGDSPQSAALPNPRAERREARGERRTTSVLAALEKFQLSDMTEWLKQEGIDLNASAVVMAEFKDYWRSVGGKRAGGKLIKDWPATFRNRVRELKAQGKIKLTTIIRAVPKVVEPVRKDPPTEEAKGILNRLMPTVATRLEQS